MTPNMPNDFVTIDVVENAKMTASYWQLTQRLRWRAEPSTTTKTPVLEQCWIEMFSGQEDWRPVPIEVAKPDPAPSQEGDG